MSMYTWYLKSRYLGTFYMDGFYTSVDGGVPRRRRDEPIESEKLNKFK